VRKFKWRVRLFVSSLFFSAFIGLSSFDACPLLPPFFGPREKKKGRKKTKKNLMCAFVPTFNQQRSIQITLFRAIARRNPRVKT
jgi:hypothetical protein